MKKVFVAVLIGAALIWLALLGLYYSSKPHYDNLVEVDGKKLVKVQLSRPKEPPDAAQKSLFFVPLEFQPKITSRLFEIYIAYPSLAPYQHKGEAPRAEMIRLIVDRLARAKGLIAEPLPKDSGKKNHPWYVGKRDYFDIYQYDYGRQGEEMLGTLMVYYDTVGNPVVIQDSGQWSHMYRVYHQFNEYIELDYLVDKQLGVDFRVIDRAMFDLVKHFQRNN